MPRLLEEQTITRGMLDRLLELCSVDYQRISYLPYMAKLRASGRYSGKQMAYVGMLHGFAIGSMADFKLPKPCSDSDRQNALANVSGLVVETP